MKMPNKVIKIYSIFRKNEGIVGFGVMAIALYKAPVAKISSTPRNSNIFKDFAGIGLN